MEKPSGQAPNSQIVKPYINAVRPQKQLGQHWLRQKSVVNKIIEAGNLKKTDLVIEIGPGLGNLTKELAQKSGKVIAIEKDSRLIPILRANLKEFNNVEIIQSDALKPVSGIEYLVSSMTNSLPDTRYKILDTRYKVVANLPYYAATAIIRQFLESPYPPGLMVLMVQKEVAKRICSQSPDMTLLAVSVQIYAEAKIIDYVSKHAFWPKPKIDSAIIRLEPKRPELKFDKILFFKIVRAGFSQPRKQLINNLSAGLGLPKNQIKDWLLKNKLEPSTRAESLEIEDWLALAKTFAS